MMVRTFRQRSPIYLAMNLALAAILLSGCGSPEARFHLNRPYALKVKQDKKVEIDNARQQEIANLLTAMFGTPDEPHVAAIPDVDLASVIDIDALKISAGPVRTDDDGRPAGLYREHCVHCHGITGDGAGPTAAFLKPYPRDYRHGKFKFKSTPLTGPPTHADLKRILIDGVPGTAMPSFKLLNDDELESLVHYVKYLSIRGQVERALLIYAADERDEDQAIADLKLLDVEVDRPLEFKDQIAEMAEFTVQPIVEKWVTAKTPKVAGPSSNYDSANALMLGSKIFHGKGNCHSCHGTMALGDGQKVIDDWTEEIVGGAKALDLEVAADFMAVGALEPRHTQPRNLRLGVYRGGRRPIDLWWRITNGITGSKMPAVSMQGDKGLTNDDVWYLIEYVRHLPYEQLSRPAQDVGSSPHFQRDRL